MNSTQHIKEKQQTELQLVWQTNRKCQTAGSEAALTLKAVREFSPSNTTKQLGFLQMPLPASSVLLLLYPLQTGRRKDQSTGIKTILEMSIYRHFRDKNGRETPFYSYYLFHVISVIFMLFW